MIKTSLRTDGGLDVEITGAESNMLTTMSYEQQIEVDELLTRLICLASINGVGKIRKSVLIPS